MKKRKIKIINKSLFDAHITDEGIFTFVKRIFGKKKYVVRFNGDEVFRSDSVRRGQDFFNKCVEDD